MNDFDPVGGGFLVQKIADFFSGSGGSASSGDFGSSILGIFKIIFIFFLILFWIGIFYVAYQLREFRPRYKLVYDEKNVPQQKIARKRWEEIMSRFEMGTESDWRLAGIEADTLVEEVFKRIGFEGETLGERITSVSSQELSALADLREAHKLRNRLVHTPGYKISKQETERSLSRYRKVLEELEVI